MEKWKVTYFVSLMAVLALSVVIGWQLLNKPSGIELETSGKIENTETPEEPSEIEKPIFHMFDVDIERFESGGCTNRISFKAQNLGNVSATAVVFAFEIKLGGEHVTLYRGEEIIPFVWYIGNTTVDVIESKRVDQYFVEVPIDFWIEANITSMCDLRFLEVLESRWNVTCAEGVSETFDF